MCARQRVITHICLMADQSLIVLPSGTLSYLVAGHGPEKVILFHGAGQHKGVFPLLRDEACLQQFTFYSFDLFFHGESTWSSANNVLDKDTWKTFMHAFLDQEKISTCCLLGFSLGARFALATVECFPQRIKRLILLAPDGLRFHFMYRLAVGSHLTRLVFKLLMNHPRALPFMNQIANKIGLIDNSMYWMIEKQTDGDEKRVRIYQSWVVFRMLKFKLRNLASLMVQHSIPIDICIARQDWFVNKKAIQQFCKEARGHYYEINTHHLGVLREGKSILMSGSPTK